MIARAQDASVTIEALLDGPDGAIVRFAGTLSHRDPAPLLRPFFDDLHAGLLKASRRRARVDLRELKFMNSSSFKHFIGWVKALSTVPVLQRYKIVFVLNKAHHWQQVSFHALGCFTPDGIEAEYA